MPISVGTRFGAYEVTSSLGSGGMGEVYRARDTNLKRDVALKALPPALANDADRLARFQREAELLASLNHPNIAQIYGLERSEGTTALAMELIEGPTLEDRIFQGRIPVEEALRVASQIADALEAAHERGIVHRDLKPANIKLRPDGVVKVLDFGIAKALDSRATTGPGPAALTTPAMTQAGMVLGTAAYMSPEQAKGKFVDERTDIWAFGCVLYEMLTGKAAFLGEDVTSTLARVLEVAANLNALPSGVSPSVRRTLELCLEKDARKRIADMRDVKLGLAGAFGQDAPKQPIWRRAWPVAATLVVAALAANAYLIGVRRSAPSQSAAPVPVSRFVITPAPTAPLSAQNGRDIAISPDGARIAYLADMPGSDHSEIYVRELDALEARPIAGTEGAASGSRNLFFSADGRFVGFAEPGRGVVAVAIDGRTAIKLADLPSPAFVGGTWTPDDKLIYSSGRGLLRVSVHDGGTPEPVLPDRTTPGAGVAMPVPLPGGHALLFHAFGDSAGDRVNVLDLDTGRETTLVEGGSAAAYVDTGHLVFVRGDTLMAVPFNAAELTVTGEPVALVPGIRRYSRGAAQFTISANGTLVYLPERREGENTASVVWVDRTGRVLGHVVSDQLRSPREPRLSPDGKRLLLVTGPAKDADIWSYELNGRPPIPIVPHGDNNNPVWSPDSKQIALIEWGHGHVVTVPADGSARASQPLREQPLGVQLQEWTPDGDLILTNANSGSIVALPVATERESREIVARDVSQSAAALSPNGRWLAYVSNRSGQSEIWVQAYPAGLPLRVSSNGGYQPLWSADGRELFYRRDGAVIAVAVETTTGEFSFVAPQQLFEGPYVQNEATRTYDVAPDGRFLMILPEGVDQSKDTGSIVVVQNFTDELKRRVPPSRK